MSHIICLKHNINTITLILVISLMLLQPVFGQESVYKIEKYSCIDGLKCSYDLRIKNKLSDSQIELIANQLKGDSPSVKKIFITYYLPCMKIGSGAWATSNFDSELSINKMDFMLNSNPACL
jgi:hypothetical protein